MFDKDVLDFFALLLSRVSVSASAVDFDEQAALVGKARRQLLAALQADSELSSGPQGVDN
jgi:hypothetical protein